MHKVTGEKCWRDFQDILVQMRTPHVHHTLLSKLEVMAFTLLSLLGSECVREAAEAREGMDGQTAT